MIVQPLPSFDNVLSLIHRHDIVTFRLIDLASLSLHFFSRLDLDTGYWILDRGWWLLSTLDRGLELERPCCRWEASVVTTHYNVSNPGMTLDTTYTAF